MSWTMAAASRILLILLLKPFHPAHEPSVFIHLGEMLDPSGISGAVPDHGQQETVCFSRPIRRTFQLPVVGLLPSCSSMTSSASTQPMDS